MLTVSQALDAILAAVRPLPAVRVALGETLGLTIAEDAISDVDSPPFDKALMDGYAVRAGDVTDGRATLTVIEEVTAGHVPSRTVGPGEATRIMTGAPLPNGADAVVRVEDTQFDAATDAVTIRTSPVGCGASVMRRGTAMRAGELVVPAGRKLRPQELGALAELGFATPLVIPRPRVAVLATGDELVPVERTPGPGQIRNSNETMLVAQIRRAGAEPVPLGIARDVRRELDERIAVGLACDVLLLSGGVSAGTLDLVPQALAAAGVREVFHQVRVKPGQPLWFGVHDGRGDGMRPTFVFGLPGNPVSSLVCFELFARTAIRRLTGIEPAAPQAVSARFAEDHLARGDRPTYYPARLVRHGAGADVHLTNWHGSADLRATVEANAMAAIPPGETQFRRGDEINVIPWDDEWLSVEG